MSMPKSMPYAPVSSDDNHISVTSLSSTTDLIRFNKSSCLYDPNLPRACLVLQYVQAPKHPVDNGTISTNGFRRTLGKSKRGSLEF